MQQHMPPGIAQGYRPCPRCTYPLTVHPHESGVLIDSCNRCAGTFLDFGEAGRVVGVSADPHKWENEAFARPPQPSWLLCPAGHGHMVNFLLAWESHQVEIDGCATCRGLWLDANEAATLNTITAAAHAEKTRPGADHGTLAFVALYVVQLATMVPVEVYNPVKRRPVVVYSLILGLIALFFLEMGLVIGKGPSVIQWIAVVPRNIEHGYVHTLFTYMFFHASIFHIAGNLYFLWIFGDNVEDRLGRGRFTLLYVVTGVAGGLAHWLGNLHSSEAMVGASGAIAGLMGAYLILFPRVKMWIVFFFFQFKLRAIWYLLLWLGMQFLLLLDKKSHVAWLAHVGGFAAGVLLALALRGSAQPARRQA